MNAQDTYAAALAAADKRRDSATRLADERHADTVDAAAAALAEALAAHDKVVGKAEAEQRAATETAHSEHQSAVTEAERALDDAKRKEHGAEDAFIERRHGALVLRTRRVELASAHPVHGKHWRLVVGERIVFMPPDPVAARCALWDTLAVAPDPVPA